MKNTMTELTAPVATLATAALATSLAVTLSGSAVADDEAGQESPELTVTRACEAAELSVYIVDGANEPDGQATIAIDKISEEVSDKPCVLGGFPSITVLSFGQPVGGAQELDVTAPIEPVVLGVNSAENAYVSFHFAPSDQETSRPSGLRITLPGVGVPIDAEWPDSLGALGSDITTSPVMPAYG